VLQNLIGKAIKYCGDARPEIRVGAVRPQDVWEFFISDNGIGIEEQYKEQIFGIFKRLHHEACIPVPGLVWLYAKRLSNVRAAGSGWNLSPDKARPSTSLSQPSGEEQ
jgi:light-regulated signal transduction histidine kinase (bacteriophytochrome)